MTTKRKSIGDFEVKYGGSRIAELEAALKQQAQARHPINLEIASADNTLVFGVIGDTHLGSRFEALDPLQALYGAFNAAGVKDVLHVGDVIDGHKVYHGQEFELHAHGWAAQRDWFVKHAPKIDGITTHFVTGNHDASMKKAAGVDVGPELADRRPDWNFLGEDYATVLFTTGNGRKFRVGLMHPSGGAAYSLSYRPQKIAEQIEGGGKPNLLCIGHYHKAEFMPSYRNIAVVQVGCCQWQTPFMVTKGLAAHVGGWIIRVTVQDDRRLSNSINAEFTAFYGAER
jgi:hypothetical protein